MAPSRARKIVGFGDIIYSTVRPYLHNMCIIDKEFSCSPIASTGFAVLSCRAGIFNKYLFYCLLAPFFNAYANSTENAKGVAYPAITDARLYNALIPVPSLAEQQRIVQHLEKLKPYIQKYNETEIALKELTVRFPIQLKKSILQLAIQGKLIPQNKTDEPARILLQRIRAEKEKLINAGKIKRDKNESIIFKRDNSYYEKIGNEIRCIDNEIPFEIPDSWEWSRVSALGTMIRGKGIKRNDLTTKGLPCLRYGEIYTTYNISFNKTISKIPIELDKHCVHLNKNDIAFTLTGENKPDIAKTIAYLGEEPVAVGGDLACWKYHGMLPLYLVYYMSSPYAISKKCDLSTGDIIVHISTGKIGSFLIPIPPIAEQQRIVKKINEMLNIVKELYND